jgi:tRNA(fMet)-specific endonuclease VapC
VGRRLILDTNVLIAHCRRAGAPRGAHALIIAAHALQTDRIVLTFDAKARFADLPGVVASAPEMGRR